MKRYAATVTNTAAVPAIATGRYGKGEGSLCIDQILMSGSHRAPIFEQPIVNISMTPSKKQRTYKNTKKKSNKQTNLTK